MINGFDFAFVIIVFLYGHSHHFGSHHFRPAWICIFSRSQLEAKFFDFLEENRLIFALLNGLPRDVKEILAFCFHLNNIHLYMRFYQLTFDDIAIFILPVVFQ